MEKEVAKEKQKRVRKTPYWKWSEREHQKLTNFLRENRPIKKPTAQIYYKHFLAEIGSELEWTLVRRKVKNLRQSFVKAKSWHNTTDAGTMQDGETTKDVMARMCPLYDELEEIYVYREFTANASVLDTEDSSNLDCPAASPGISIPTGAVDVAEICNEGETSPLPETPTNTLKVPRKGIYSRTPLADILEVHSSLVVVRKEKMEMDLAMKEKELLLKEKEHELHEQMFRFGKDKNEAELKIKEAEISSGEKIKLKELEMRERIAIKELEMKERIEMENIKVNK